MQMVKTGFPSDVFDFLDENIVLIGGGQLVFLRMSLMITLVSLEQD